MKPEALLLAPGSGGDRDHPTLRAIEAALSPMPVSRIDLRTTRAPKAIATIRDAAGALVTDAGVRPASLALGGRSFGGRMCSMAVAEGLPAAALVLISYPLHPPGKPGDLRVAHFPELRVPCLFVSGTRDAFATPDELEHHTASIAGAVTHVWVDGATHGLKGHDVEIAATVTQWLARLRG